MTFQLEEIAGTKDMIDGRAAEKQETHATVEAARVYMEHSHEHLSEHRTLDSVLSSSKDTKTNKDLSRQTES